jgi:outer membrane protein assembly factor BamB
MPWLRSAILVFLLAAVARAEDWPQWLGPRRDSSSTETVKPWKGPLKVAWRQPVGEGDSGSLVAGGKVYLHTKKKGADEEVIETFAVADGKPGWTASYPRGKGAYFFGNGPRATPAVVGDHLYTFGITGLLTCFDLKAHKQLWQVDTHKELGAPKLFFGASCSPLVEGDAVLLNVGGKGTSIVAFDKDKGAVLWKKLDDPASYASPIAFGPAGQRQAVFLTGLGVVSLSPKDGTVFWQFPYKDKANESSITPVKANDVLVACAITKGSVGLKLEGQGPDSKASKLWQNPKLTCYFSTPVLVGENLYLVTSTPPKKPLQVFGEAVLRCVEVNSGKELWQGPKVGTFHASLLRTADNKLLMLEEEGDLVLLEPNTKGYKELCRSKICNKTWSHPAVSDGCLFVRDGKELVCVELPQ